MPEITQAIDLSMFDRFGDPDKIMTMMEPYVRAALDIVKGAVRERTPVGASGLLRRSIAYEWSKTGLTAMGRIYPYGKAGEYAPFVEYGRLPGKFPPWGVDSALFNWVKVKVRTAEYAATGKKGYKAITRKTKVTDEGKRLLQISFLIARAIAEHGTFPKGAPHMFELAWAETRDDALAVIESGINEVMAQL